MKRHPGGTTISITFRTHGALEADTAPLPNLTVSPNEHFVAEVEDVLGKGALSLLSYGRILGYDLAQRTPRTALLLKEVDARLSRI